WFEVPGDPRENYIARMEWVTGANSHQVLIEHLNRLQNNAEILVGDAASGKTKQVFQDHDDAWVDYMPEFVWFNSGKEFFWLSERSGWRHVYRVSLEGKIAAVTHGGFDVIAFSGIDEKAGLLYFIASPDNATQRYLYRARLDGTGDAQRVTPGSLAGTHAYDVSPDGRWVFHIYSSFSQPPKTDLLELATHRPVRVLVENEELRVAAAPILAASPAEFFKVDAGDGTTMDGWMFKPADFDSSKKYPVLVYVYGEPAGQTVLDEWSGWNEAVKRRVGMGRGLGGWGDQRRARRP